MASTDGWLRRKVGGGVDKLTAGKDVDPGNNVHLKATIVISKKLLHLDLIDRLADLHDDATEVLGHKVSVTLVSTKADPKTGKGMRSKKVALENWISTVDLGTSKDFDFTLHFYVPKEFGAPGAILVENEHPNEFNLVSFNVVLADGTVAHFTTDSWVYNTKGTEGRIFFRNQVYLPSETPEGLKELRQKELENMRGDGTGRREFKDRIYDYEVYNDLGRPDEDPAKWLRPTLGGDPVIQYPRRCRTGRAPSKYDPKYESRTVDGELIYIPRDERFDRIKNSDFKADTYRSKLHAAPTSLDNKIKGDAGWASEKEVKALFAPKGNDLGGLNNLLPDMVDVPKEEQNSLVFLNELLRPDNQPIALKYPLPKILHVDEHAWQQDDEFAREFLAGLNPTVIKLVREFPIKSALPESEFGDAASAITEKHIVERLEGMSVTEAVAKKKLFVADYHDLYLPFVNRINEQPGSALYATRALFFMSREGILKALALELVLPPKNGQPKRTRVFTPPVGETTKNWVWELSKAHVQSNDIFVHQVITHFLRCHSATEPYLIATNRQLSALHPVNQNLQPHFKSTLETNIAARDRLVNAGGIIESVFTPQRYAMEMAAVDYGKSWTFESQMLPVDLIRRGMAERAAPGAPLTLVVEDYPYAADGLMLWDAINAWNLEFVRIYYPSDAAVTSDAELQRWWTEIRAVGHGDKRDAPGWPSLTTRAALATVLSTIQWIGSVQHAAVNFGQYHYGGYMPHHPTFTRKLIPEKDSPEWTQMMRDPEKFYMSCLSNKEVTTKVMSVYEVLSSHSPDEEYIGQRKNANWTASEDVKAAFRRFGDRIAEIDRVIRERNANPKLKNRLGPVMLPYELQIPVSEQGMTGRGIPNSITI